MSGNNRVFSIIGDDTGGGEPFGIDWGDDLAAFMGGDTISTSAWTVEPATPTVTLANGAIEASDQTGAALRQTTIEVSAPVSSRSTTFRIINEIVTVTNVKTLRAEIAVKVN